MAKTVKKATKKATKRVTRKKITNLIIIDASGSMQSKVDDVKKGLSEILAQVRIDMKKDKKTVNMRNIILDFSGRGDIRVLVDSNKIEDLNDDIANAYSTRGMTALYDAIGKGFNMLTNKEYAVFVNILTDGEENNSAEFTAADIKKFVDNARAKNWAVTFLGTTDAAINTATSMGISKGNSTLFSNSSTGIKKSLTKVMSVRSTYYSGVTGPTGSIGTFGTASSAGTKNLDTLMEDDAIDTKD